MRKRRWKRWTCALGGPKLGKLCIAARSNGMEIIDSFKLGMTVHNVLALYGTAEQMRETERDWLRMGCDEVHSRQPRGAWPPHHKLPRDKWAERWFERGEAFTSPVAERIRKTIA